MKKLIIATSIAMIAAGSAYAKEEGSSGHEGGSGGNNGPQAYQTQTAAPRADADARINASADVGTMKMQQGQEQAAIAGSNSQNAGNEQNITFSSPGYQQIDTHTSVSGSTTLKNVPAITAPALTSSNDTCMGSSSIGAAAAGWGVSFGSTWTDANCLMLKNSREMWNMGMKAAAMARMCMDSLNKEALELTGFVCPTKKAEPAPAPKAAIEVAPTAATEPFVFPGQ